MIYLAPQIESNEIKLQLSRQSRLALTRDNIFTIYGSENSLFRLWCDPMAAEFAMSDLRVSAQNSVLKISSNKKETMK
jgi:hypothetical protein